MATTGPATRPPFTSADLAHLPDDGNRYEVLDGRLLVTPAPVPRHQHVVMSIATAFSTAGAFVLPAPVDIVLDDATTLQPDVCVWHRRPDLDARPLRRPDLVVEVGSPYTWRRDLTSKADRYAAEGIEEYWFVDVRDDRLRRHGLVSGRYEVEEGDRLRSLLLDVELSLDELTA